MLSGIDWPNIEWSSALLWLLALLGTYSFFKDLAPSTIRLIRRLKENIGDKTRHSLVSSTIDRLIYLEALEDSDFANVEVAKDVVRLIISLFIFLFLVLTDAMIEAWEPGFVSAIALGYTLHRGQLTLRKLSSYQKRASEACACISIILENFSYITLNDKLWQKLKNSKSDEIQKRITEEMLL